MFTKPVAHMLADLGVTKALGRPQVSNDNPLSESEFRTFKHRPEFPDWFETFEVARVFAPPSSVGTTTTIVTRASA